jgi:hypothetical protein
MFSQQNKKITKLGPKFLVWFWTQTLKNHQVIPPQNFSYITLPAQRNVLFMKNKNQRILYENCQVAIKE